MAITPNYYETLYTTRPDLKEEDLAKIQQKLLDSISNNEGEIVKAEKWAERELAYEIQDHKRGIYYILVFKALPDASKEVEKHLQFYRTDVLRFMTLKITEEAANKHKKSKEDKAAKAEPTPTPEVEAEPAPTPEVEVEPAPVPEVEAEIAPASEVEAEPAPAPEVEAEPAPVPEVEAEIAPAPEVEAEIAPAPEVEAEPAPAVSESTEEVIVEEEATAETTEVITSAQKEGGTQ
jgi:small subunit ribosomal protein S6